MVLQAFPSKSRRASINATYLDSSIFFLLILSKASEASLSLLVDFDAEFSRSKKYIYAGEIIGLLRYFFFNNESSISIRVFQVEAGEPHTDSNCEHVRDLCSNLSSFILPDHELCRLTLR